MKVTLYIPHTRVPPSLKLTLLEEINLLCYNYPLQLSKLSGGVWEIILDINDIKEPLTNYFYLHLNQSIIPFNITYPYSKKRVDKYLVVIYYQKKYINNRKNSYQSNIFKCLGYLKPRIYKIVIS